MNRVLACVLGILVASTAFASEYIWPLEQNNGISATFGEFREDHFHAGIDLSTNGETGLPVLAVADGVIFRMKIQKRAYGKALYIRHPNGMVSLYAHLEGYSQELGLQKLYLDQVAQKKTKYVGDIFVEPGIPVKQGQIVAYSGESGAGLPHLHFELRKNEDIAVNPLENGFQDAMDPVPPTFQACFLYPMDHDSAIDGQLETKEIKFNQSQSGFLADSVPVVRGDFLASVSVYDSAAKPYHRGPEKILYGIDDRLIYSIDFDQFSYSEPSAFGLFYDLGKPGVASYEYPIRMAKLVDVHIPFVNKAIAFSTRTLAPGRHSLRIQAIDSNGNISIADLPFIVNQPPSIQLDSVQLAPDAQLIVQATLTDGNQQLNAKGEVEYSIDGGKTFTPFVTSILDLLHQGHFEYRTASPAFNSAHSILIRARAFDGVEYSPYSIAQLRAGKLASTPAHLSGTLQFVPFGDAIQVTYEGMTPVAGSLEANVAEPQRSFSMTSSDANTRTALIPAPKLDASYRITIQDRNINVPVHFLTAAKASEIAEGNFHLSFPANSLYSDSFVWTKSLPQKYSRTLPVIGSALQLTPRGTPLNQDATLQFRYSGNVVSPQRLGVYRWDRSTEKWKPLASHMDAPAKTVEAKISYFDLYALILDNVPPVITPIFPKRKTVTSDPTPVFTAGILDAGSDVDDERVTFYIDGKAYAAEYDPDRNTATLKITDSIRKGYHKFSVKAYDFAGNQSRSSITTFRIK